MLNFGFAQEDITPKIGVSLAGYFNHRSNRGFYDRLAVKAAIFECDGLRFGLVSCDLCMMDNSLVVQLIAALKAAGIDFADNIVFAVTHTHTGPCTTLLFNDNIDHDYMQRFEHQVVTSVIAARDNLAPATLAATRTICSHLAFNRRYWMKDGQVLTNPGKQNCDIVRPEGTTDPEIPILAVKQNGRMALLIVNISNHSDTIGGHFVSADWPGRMERAIQQEVEYDLPVMTLIAPQGNINHFNVATTADQTNYAEANRIGKAYAAVVLSALYALEPLTCDRIKVATESFDAPYIDVSDAEYAEARRVVAANRDAVMEEGRDLTSEDIARKLPAVLKLFAQDVVDCRERPHTGKRSEIMSAISFGEDFVIVSLPAEPFVEIGLKIKATSPFRYNMVAALGMGEVGYVGLPENYGRGNAYETIPSPRLADRNLGLKFIEVAERLLKQTK